jgi:hypothetical protein
MLRRWEVIEKVWEVKWEDDENGSSFLKLKIEHRTLLRQPLMY